LGPESSARTRKKGLQVVLSRGLVDTVMVKVTGAVMGEAPSGLSVRICLRLGIIVTPKGEPGHWPGCDSLRTWNTGKLAPSGGLGGLSSGCWIRKPNTGEACGEAEGGRDTDQEAVRSGRLGGSRQGRPCSGSGEVQGDSEGDPLRGEDGERRLLVGERAEDSTVAQVTYESEVGGEPEGGVRERDKPGRVHTLR